MFEKQLRENINHPLWFDATRLCILRFQFSSQGNASVCSHGDFID